jgi:tRNA-splicing ligase RtcB
MDLKTLKRISDHEWEIAKAGDMRVPARVFASKGIIKDMDEKVREQATNVATLPGIEKASLVMPDGHWGY